MQRGCAKIGAMSRGKYGSGSVRQRGPQRWQLRWSEGVDPFTGERVVRSETVNAATKTEANRMLSARIAATGKTSRMTLGQLIDVTLDQLDVAPITKATYGHALAHIPPAALGWVAADITPMDARRLVAGLVDRHGPQTVRKAHGALMSIWRHAAGNGWLTSNPWRGQRLPKVPTSAGTALTPAEVAALLAAVDGPLEDAWLRIHLATGARPGEVVGLRWSAIDADECVVSFIDAKHGDRVRPVAVDVATVAATRAWQQCQRERAMAAGVPLDADPWLISAAVDSATPWQRSYAGGFRWRRLRARAEIRPTLRLYDLRHTHNSWLTAAGIDEATRGQRIGNTPAVNLRTYSHATRDRDAADVVAAMLSS